MRHRNIDVTGWTRMAIASLFERGTLADWKEFAHALRVDPDLAARTLATCARHEERGSAALARVLVEQFHPRLEPASRMPGRG